ncbi:hypothetical protein ACOZDF_28475 [Streptomyces griseoincarnatus]
MYGGEAGDVETRSAELLAVRGLQLGHRVRGADRADDAVTRSQRLLGHPPAEAADSHW